MQILGVIKLKLAKIFRFLLVLVAMVFGLILLMLAWVIVTFENI